jgi:hypothetical protein
MTPPGANANRGWIIVFTRWFVVIMCAGFGAAGGFALWSGLKERKTNTEAASWPSAKGSVLRSWVRTVEGKSGKQPGPQYRSQMYDVMIEYSFTAEGQTITASSAAPRQIVDEEGRTAAQAIADSFVPGAAITVYYRPGNPRENRLQRVEVSSSVWLWWAVLGGITVLASLPAIWWMVCRFERQKSI